MTTNSGSQPLDPKALGEVQVFAAGELQGFISRFNEKATALGIAPGLASEMCIVALLSLCVEVSTAVKFPKERTLQLLGDLYGVVERTMAEAAAKK